MLRLLTAGESHGRALVAIVEGLPAGLPITEDEIRGELARRRLGYGRGPRQRFETQRPGAREQVQAASARHLVLQPVEQGFAHPIGRRPQIRQIRKCDPPAPPGAADDAHGTAPA